MFWTLTVLVTILVVVYYVIEYVLRSLKVDKVTDKHVLITGCDTGFGRLAAERFDKLGVHVFAGCLTKDGAKSLSETCSSRLTPIILDVSTTDSIEQAVEFVKRQLPPDTGLWALINNAGIFGLFAPAELCSRQDVLHALNINLLGVIDMIHHFLPLVRKSRGRIVNTSSMAGRIAVTPAPYTISKYGVEGFSDVLRRDVQPQGIKVSIVEPGGFRTPIINIDRIVGDAEKTMARHSPEQQAVYGGALALKKVRDSMMYLQKHASPKLDLVVDAYVHAVLAKFPQSRYPVGFDAKWFYVPMSYLPTYIADFIISNLF